MVAVMNPNAAVSHPTTAAVACGLDDWPLHAQAQIVGLATPATDEQAHTLLRLLEVGFLPGECVRLTACGLPGRDPLAVRVGQSTFALRRHEAALIRVAPPAVTLAPAHHKVPGSSAHGQDGAVAAVAGGGA